jgi:hypothetical protein
MMTMMTHLEMNLNLRVRSHSEPLTDIVIEQKQPETLPKVHQHPHLSPEVVLPKVEDFLLPGKIIQETENSDDTTTLPTTRLDEMLLELSIGEHLRMCQYLYRDNEDECQVSPEVRQLSKDGMIRITSKQLTESLIEGRSRVVALCRLCYGDESMEYLRAIVDLASVYAMQGLWDQVSHHMTIASQKLITVTHALQSSTLRSISHDAALYTMTLFTALRSHAIAHRGYVVGSFLTEVKREIESAVHSTMASKASQLKQEEYYTELLAQQTHSSHYNEKQEEEEGRERVGGEREERDNQKTVATAICSEIEEFLTGYLGPKANWNQSLSQFSPPSWGQMVVFLTTQSTVMRRWSQLIEGTILPQNKSLLRMVFQLGDKKQANICHPMELSHLLHQYPSIAKILSGTAIVANLQKIPLEVPILLDGQTGEVLTYLTPELQSMFSLKQSTGGNNQQGTAPTSIQQVKYELPICWIEFLSRVLFEWNTEGGLDGIEYLRIHILNLMSLCSVYSNQLSLAEENMKNALGRIELLGLEMESIAIDVYNGISQLMIVKHKQWHSEKKERCHKNAMKWLQTTREGKSLLHQEIRRIQGHYLEHKKIHLSLITVEEMAIKFILKNQIKELMKYEIDPTLSSLEAAYRYMIRTYEILEKIHSNDHITVASASLAIASVQNIIGSYEESKEWLVRSIRIMEKLQPLPCRAIAFTQTQLSLILIKLKHTKSAEKVLSVAVDYYSNYIMKKLNRQIRLLHNAIPSSTSATSFSGIGGGMASLAIGGITSIGGMSLLNSSVLQDIEVTLDLLKRLMVLNGENGAVWQAAEYAENMADISEAAYGWDSQETAELRKQAGERQCQVKDWGRASGNMRKSLEAHQLLYGEKDKRSLALQKQLQVLLHSVYMSVPHLTPPLVR